MKIRRQFMWFLILFVGITSCKKINGGVSDDIANIKNRYEGQYSIVSALSDKEVDVNLDGIVSKELLNEISNLKYSYLGFKFNERGQNNLFYQFWPNQSLSSETKVITYDPRIVVTYINQGTSGFFNIEDPFKKITIFRNDETPEIRRDSPLPKLIEVIQNNEIHVVIDKTVYTTSGFIPITIDLIYRRFTNKS